MQRTRMSGLTWLGDADNAAPIQAAAGDTANGNAPLVLIVVQIGHQHLQGRVQVHRRGCNLLHNGLEQGARSSARSLGSEPAMPFAPDAYTTGKSHCSSVAPSSTNRSNVASMTQSGLEQSHFFNLHPRQSDQTSLFCHDFSQHKFLSQGRRSICNTHWVVETKGTPTSFSRKGEIRTSLICSALLNWNICGHDGAFTNPVSLLVVLRQNPARH